MEDPAGHPGSALVLITARKRSLGQGNMFTGMCLSTVGCGVGTGVPASRGDACSRRRGCREGGVWAGSACSQGGCLVWGCLVETPHPSDSYYCGRYASYWNAFLFLKLYLTLSLHCPYIQKMLWLFKHEKSFTMVCYVLNEC